MPKAKPSPARPVEVKTGVVRARIDDAIKKEAEAVLERCGTSSSEAIRLLFHQIVLRQGLPFEINIPNATTRQAMRDVQAGKVVEFDSPEAMFRDLGI